MKSWRLALFIALTVALAACSTAPRHTIKSEERADDWHGRAYKKILVVGLYDDRAFRVSSESVFAEELSAKSVAASASYDVIPKLDSLSDEAALRQTLADGGYDAVLTISTLEASDYNGGGWEAAEAWLYAFGADTRILRGANAYNEYEAGKYVLGIHLWDASTLSAVWNATTDSYGQGTGSDEVKQLADFMVETLRERGFI
ncbi:MAG: hypothetical protein V3U14_04750 [candidate division NC10 bacterium]